MPKSTKDPVRVLKLLGYSDLRKHAGAEKDPGPDDLVRVAMSDAARDLCIGLLYWRKGWTLQELADRFKTTVGAINQRLLRLKRKAAGVDSR